MNTERNARIKVYLDNPAKFKILEDRLEGYEGSWFYTNGTAPANSTGDEAFVEIVGRAYGEWGDVRDDFSSSGTRGGMLYSYDAAEGEIKELMDQLYLEDVISDWEYEQSLPDGAFAA